VSLGIGIVGGRGENSSGDLFVGFSTANAEVSNTGGTVQLQMLPNERINPLFRATVNATEEAIVNSLVAAKTMSGVNGNISYAIPHDRLRDLMIKYQRPVR
jgi:L-aminopeptidase/D-esterase-like protein